MLPCIDLLQLGERFVERQDVDLVLLVTVEHVVEERNPLPAAPTFLRISRTGVIDEYPAHGLRRCGKETSPIHECLQNGGLKHAQKGFVDQRRGLERVASSLVGHEFSGHSAKLCVYAANQLISGGTNSLARFHD